MAQALETRAATTAEIYFELDRFEPTEDGLCVELSGRWFGVRGRRFVRPTLTMLVGGVRRRLLADLEHKPWAAEDGSSWIASFPWELEGEPVSELELGVAPDLEIGLPVPGSAPQRAEVRRGRQVAPRRHDGADESARALDAARGENDRLRDELERAADAKVEAAAAIARRDTALSKLDELTEARGATLAERDAAVLGRFTAAIRRLTAANGWSGAAPSFSPSSTRRAQPFTTPSSSAAGPGLRMSMRRRAPSRAVRWRPIRLPGGGTWDGRGRPRAVQRRRPAGRGA